MENYEQKYNKLVEAIKVLQKTNPSDEGIQNWVNDNVPELRESEDDKVRKDLIGYFRDEQFLYHKKEEIIAWLEKQGKETSWKPSKEEMDVLYGLAYITNQYDEHKEEVITRLYQDLKREFFNGSSYENMFPTNTSTEDDVRRRSTIQVLEYARSLDAYNQYGKADIDKNIAWLEKQGEQKPAWSKEDECMLNNVINVLEPLSQTTHSGYAIKSMITWLKSIKPQNRWKPTDEQMEALANALSLAKNCGDESSFDLRTLYDDLTIL